MTPEDPDDFAPVEVVSPISAWCMDNARHPATGAAFFPRRMGKTQALRMLMARPVNRSEGNPVDLKAFTNTTLGEPYR